MNAPEEIPETEIASLSMFSPRAKSRKEAAMPKFEIVSVHMTTRDHLTILAHRGNIDVLLSLPLLTLVPLDSAAQYKRADFVNDLA
jgi:hypothetical protein